MFIPFFRHCWFPRISVAKNAIHTAPARDCLTAIFGQVSEALELGIWSVWWSCRPLQNMGWGRRCQHANWSSVCGYYYSTTWVAFTSAVRSCPKSICNFSPSTIARTVASTVLPSWSFTFNFSPTTNREFLQQLCFSSPSVDLSTTRAMAPSAEHTKNLREFRYLIRRERL